MAIHAPITGAPTRTPAEYLDEATLMLENASGMAGVLARYLETECAIAAPARACHGLAAIMDRAVENIEAAYPAITPEGR